MIRRNQCVYSFIIEISENDLLYPASNQEAVTADGWRALGRCTVARIQTCAGEQTVVYSAGSVCLELSYQNASLLKMNIFRPLLRRKRSTQTGGGQQDDRRELAVARTSSSRRPHRCRTSAVHQPLNSAIFTFLGKKVVYPPANLGASSTNF